MPEAWSIQAEELHTRRAMAIGMVRALRATVRAGQIVVVLEF
jgi:hypothetical protein